MSIYARSASGKALPDVPQLVSGFCCDRDLAGDELALTLECGIYAPTRHLLLDRDAVSSRFAKRLHQLLESLVLRAALPRQEISASAVLDGVGSRDIRLRCVRLSLYIRSFGVKPVDATAKALCERTLGVCGL